MRDIAGRTPTLGNLDIKQPEQRILWQGGDRRGDIGGREIEILFEHLARRSIAIYALLVEAKSRDRTGR